MRPNLMSPRRVATSGEDSILAMLEREPARKRGQGGSGPRLAWYGASALTALALTGTLVWMAANNDGLRREPRETALADAGAARRDAPADGAPTAGATLVRVAMAPRPAALQAEPASAAVIVDQAPPERALPPLRLLKPAPEHPPAQRAAPAPVAAAAPTPPRAVGRTLPVARPAAVAARARPSLAAKPGARPLQPRPARKAGAENTAEGPVDADVALISAVIVHANGHAPENSQMTELLCPNEACQARPARK